MNIEIESGITHFIIKTKYYRFFFHNSHFIASVTVGQNRLSKVLKKKFHPFLFRR